MPRPNSCCNPRKKKNHNRVFKNVKLINENWNDVFQNLIGKYVCDSCRRSILTLNSVQRLQVQNIPIPQIDGKNSSKKKEDPSTDGASSSDEVDCELQNPSYHCESEDKYLKRKSADGFREDVKVKHGKLSFVVGKSTVENKDIQNQTLINDVEIALSKAI